MGTMELAKQSQGRALDTVAVEVLFQQLNCPSSWKVRVQAVGY